MLGIMPITWRGVTESEADLDEPLRKVAKQVDGKWVIDTLPENYSVQNVGPLKSAFEAEKQRRREAVELAQPFIDAGISREDAKAAADALQRAKAGTLKSPEEFERFKSKLEADLKAKDEAFQPPKRSDATSRSKAP